jgi:hypothetical protein
MLVTDWPKVTQGFLSVANVVHPMVCPLLRDMSDGHRDVASAFRLMDVRQNG